MTGLGIRHSEARERVRPEGRRRKHGRSAWASTHASCWIDVLRQTRHSVGVTRLPEHVDLQLLLPRKPQVVTVEEGDVGGVNLRDAEGHRCRHARFGLHVHLNPWADLLHRDRPVLPGLGLLIDHHVYRPRREGLTHDRRQGLMDEGLSRHRGDHRRVHAADSRSPLGGCAHMGASTRENSRVPPASPPMTLVTGNLPFAGHTITNLCHHVSAQRPEDTCIVESNSWSLEPHGDSRDVRELGPRDILHLGNNPHSVPLVMAMKHGGRGATVVLHDLWLFDLVDAWGEATGSSRLALRVLAQELGVRASQQALYFRAGHLIEQEQVASMAACLMRSILPPDTRVIVHRDSAFVQETLARAGLGDVCRAALPLHYARLSPPRPVRPARWDIAVSGTGSFARRLPVIVDALKELSGERPIRVILIGGMSRAAEECHLEPGSTVDVVPTADDAHWSELHASTRVGIRLGVGQLGEGSGLVRDYLAHGMAVITDDDEPPIRGHAAVHLVAPDASPDQVAQAALVALASQEVPATREDPAGLEAYSASLLAALDPPRGSGSVPIHG